MTENLRQKLAKIYTLIERGATEGEKKAARAAMDRIVAKHGIDDGQLEDLAKREMKFTYVSQMEVQLLLRLLKKFAPDHSRLERRAYGKKTVHTKVDYLEAVSLECAYEYFRRHMKSEWIRTCAPLVSRCRTAKGKNKRRETLQLSFMATYFLRSGLVEEEGLTKVECKTKAQQDAVDRIRGVQGGAYHKQADSGRYLN